MKLVRTCILFSIILSKGLMFASAQVEALNYYVSAAIANSPVLKDYATQAQQNSIDSAMAGTAYKPYVGVNGLAAYAPTYGQFGYDQAISNGGEYDALISVSQQIAPRKKLMVTRMLSASQREVIAAKDSMAKNDLKKEVTDKYLAICLLQQKEIFYSQSDSFLVKETSIAKQLAAKGSYKISDYYALLVEEKAERAQIEQLLMEVTRSFSDINLLCGISDTAQYKLTIPHIVPYEQKNMNQLLAYQAFSADSVKIARQDELVNAGYKPNLSWYADAGIEASRPNLIYKSFGNSIGLKFSIPIYDGNKRAMKHQYLQLSEDIRAGYEHFFTINHNTRINLLAKQIEDGNLLVMQLKQEAAQAQEWQKIDAAEMAVGSISVTDFLLSLKKNLEVKNELCNALINQQLLQNEFNYQNH